MCSEQYSQVPFYTNFSQLILAKKQQQVKESLYNVYNVHACSLYKQSGTVSFLWLGNLWNELFWCIYE